jgi:hypothetical protein
MSIGSGKWFKNAISQVAQGTPSWAKTWDPSKNDFNGQVQTARNSNGNDGHDTQNRVIHNKDGIDVYKWKDEYGRAHMKSYVHGADREILLGSQYMDDNGNWVNG